MHTAAEAGDMERCRALVEEGAAVNDADVFKRTPLINAVVNGHEEVAAHLAEARADLAAADRSGWTACSWLQRGQRGGLRLHWAAFLGKSELVKLCLHLGADPRQKDLRGSTPREVAEHVLKGQGEFGEGLQGDRGFAAVLELL
ncbi:unnamed protein product [Effrenium voratum]|nr:unnamed protein product [Effrenium voratum]CAJ1418487.1 unnamed protein product [Effrenium voratum]